MSQTEIYTTLWTEFATRARRLVCGYAPRDAVDRAISWQLEGTQPFCHQALALPDLQLPELHSGAPWRADLDRPLDLGRRWVAFVALNPGLTEDEDCPTVADLEKHGVHSLIDFLDTRFDPTRTGPPLRRGRERGRPRHYQRGTGRSRPSATWSLLDNILGEALAGVRVDAPLGHAAALVDAVPLKFRNWGRVDRRLQAELVDWSAPLHLAFLREVHPTTLVLLGSATRRLLVNLPPLRGAHEPKSGVVDHGLRRLGPDGPPVRVLYSHHPVSHAFATGGCRQVLAARLREALLEDDRDE